MAICKATSIHQVRIQNEVGTVSYTWTADSPAVIESGQGTDTVTVSTESETDVTFDLTCEVQDDITTDSITKTITHKREALVPEKDIFGYIDEFINWGTDGSGNWTTDGASYTLELLTSPTETIDMRPLIKFILDESVKNGKEYTVRFNATISSGTPIIHKVAVGSDTIDVSHTVVDGLNEFTFIANNDHDGSVLVYHDGTNLWGYQADSFEVRIPIVPIQAGSLYRVSGGSCTYPEGSTECTAQGVYGIDVLEGDGNPSYEWSVTNATIVGSNTDSTVTLETTSDSDVTFELTCTLTDSTGTVTAAAEGIQRHNQESDAPYTFIPGVYGYGMDTRGPFETTSTPTILHVDTLEGGSVNTDSTHGSLKWCVEQDFPRIIVFDVSGVIRTTGMYWDKMKSNCWIAGQTAPGVGICHYIDREWRFHNNVKDFIMQHIRIRNSGNEDDRDCCAYSGSHLQERVHVINCSLSWGTDEILSCGAHDGGVNNKNLTWARNIVSAGIRPHSCGSLIQGTNVSIIGSYYVHCNNRMPWAGSGGKFAFYNNVVYNWGFAAGQFGGKNKSDDPAGTQEMHLIGSEWEPGNDSDIGNIVMIIDGWSNQGMTNRIYMEDNIYNGENRPGIDIEDNGYPYTVVDSPLEVPNYTPIASDQVRPFVFDNCGAWPAFRDKYDEGFISDLYNGTGAIPDVAPDLDYLEYPEETDPFVPVENPFDMYDENYTNIEKQLHDLAYYVENGVYKSNSFDRKGNII